MQGLVIGNLLIPLVFTACQTKKDVVYLKKQVFFTGTYLNPETQSSSRDGDQFQERQITTGQFRILTAELESAWNRDRCGEYRLFSASVYSSPGACFSKVPKFFWRTSGDIILFVSSKRKRIEGRNFAVIFIFILFTTYEKTSFTE